MSQLIASFFACGSQGIHSLPFSASFIRLLVCTSLFCCRLPYDCSLRKSARLTLLCFVCLSSPVCQRSSEPLLIHVGMPAASNGLVPLGILGPLSGSRQRFLNQVKSAWEGGCLPLLSPCNLPVTGAFLCPFSCLFCCCSTLFRGTPERRCSSRTFRYGYLVTT